MVKPIGLLALPFVGLIWAGTHADLRARASSRWVKTARACRRAPTPSSRSPSASASAGSARSPPRARCARGSRRRPRSGMLSGNVRRWFGLGDHVDAHGRRLPRPRHDRRRRASSPGCACKPQGRTAVRALVLAFLAVVALGPVVQPWYLLWVLPLAAATGPAPRASCGSCCCSPPASRSTACGRPARRPTASSSSATASPCSPPRSPSGSRSASRRASASCCSAARCATASCPTTRPPRPAGRRLVVVGPDARLHGTRS